jgi:hypothetical protein
MSHHSYYRDGVQIPEVEAIDPRTGVIKDRVVMRVATMFRDTAPEPTYHRVTAASGATAGNRPGFRIVRDQDTPASEPGLIGHDEPPDRHRFDGMTVDQIERSHQENMRRIYDEVACKQSEAWKQR